MPELNEAAFKAAVHRYLDILQHGEPYMLKNGKMIRKTPSAATFREINKFLRDHGHTLPKLRERRI
ncbi:MAG TPA: hypothetical protein VKY65_14650 [Alphaproteobacteria bacterium]|nr:hypothetical protein [Alphaproteobacteria bacterium]